MRKPWRNMAMLAGVAALGACAYPNPAHVAALDAMVGKSEQDVVQAYGVPSRSYDLNGHRYLAYTHSRLVTIPGTPGFGPWGGPYWGGWGGWGGGGWGGFPPEIAQRDCETTFDLVGHVVKTWTLRGNAC